MENNIIEDNDMQGIQPSEGEGHVFPTEDDFILNVSTMQEDKQAIELLEELVFLKKYKDLNGKDALYQKRQPIAWEKAYKLVEENDGWEKKEVK